MVWPTEQIAQWQRIEQQYQADTSAIASYKNICQERSSNQQEMLQMLCSFLDGTMKLKEFNSVFQHKTHGTWSAFHLRGMSGGLFLNKLTKYIPCEEAFTHLLRMILRAPVNKLHGQKNMETFIQFLEEIISSHQATRLQIQPARAPFFLSAWWHIQEPEQWPIFYLEIRHVLSSEDKELKSSQDAVGAYFRFRERFLVLLHRLSMHSWELEHFIRWYAHQNFHETLGEEQKSSEPIFRSVSLLSPGTELSIGENMNSTNKSIEIVPGNNGPSCKKLRETSSHTHLQWLLAKIGLKVGCSVWIATGDHEKVWNDERLGDLSLSSFPLEIDPTFQPVIDQADILWLRKNDVIAACEIERTPANISTSLLRLYDLGILFPKREAHFYIVTPKIYFERIQLELARPIFQRQDISKRCKIISEEYLMQHAEHILRWTTSPAVLEELSAYLDN